MRHFVFSTGVVLFLFVGLVACGGSSSGPTSPSSTQAGTRIIGLNGNLGFGDMLVGNSKTSPLTITNMGTSMLTVTGLTGPSGYTATWTSGTIPPGGSQVTTIGFAPTAPGVYNGTLTVVGDQTSGNNSAPIAGTAYANMNGGWTGSSTGSGLGLSTSCNMTWIVSGQTGSNFTGTWQTSGSGCGQAGTVTGVLSPTNVVSSLNISATVAPSSCTWVSGDKTLTGSLSGSTLTAQMMQTIQCSGQTISRSMTVVMNKQ